MKKSMKLLAMALAGTFVLSGCADNADKQTASETAAETTAKSSDEAESSQETADQSTDASKNSDNTSGRKLFIKSGSISYIIFCKHLSFLLI